MDEIIVINDETKYIFRGDKTYIVDKDGKEKLLKANKKIVDKLLENNIPSTRNKNEDIQ
jgi:hypothetical protein